jgi:hypothetical protein
MNINLVTSNHAKQVFDEAVFNKEVQGQPTVMVKNTKPMEVLFWGADARLYKKTNTILPSVEVEFNAIEEDFCFLFVGQWTHGDIFSDRKDIGNLIRIFCETFKDQGAKPKPALIIKTSGAAICNMDKYEMINRLKIIKGHIENQFGTKDIPNVYLVYGDLTDLEMNSLYNHPKVKAHVSFTHGEGFGHPLLLSTLSGKPLYVSNWSGHRDFLDPKMANLLDGKIDKIAPSCVNEWLIADSSWFTVDYPRAADKLRNCFYYYKETLDKAEQLRSYNAEHFSVAAMDIKFHALLDQYVPKFAVEQKLVLPKLKKISNPATLAASTASVEESQKMVLPKLKKITNPTSPPSEDITIVTTKNVSEPHPATILDNTDYTKVNTSTGKNIEELVDTLIKKIHSMVAKYMFNTVVRRYEEINKLDGDIVECGVWRGGFSIFLAHLFKTKKIWMVDSYEGFQSLKDATYQYEGVTEVSPGLGYQKSEPNTPEREHKEWDWDIRIPIDVVRNNMKEYGLVEEDRIKLVKGFVNKTLPVTPIDKIALLRIDIDTYSATLDVLNHLYPKVVSGGMVIFDDSSLIAASDACKEYFTSNGIPMKLRHPVTDEELDINKFYHINNSMQIGGGYIIKP